MRSFRRLWWPPKARLPASASALRSLADAAEGFNPSELAREIRRAFADSGGDIARFEALVADALKPKPSGKPPGDEETDPPAVEMDEMESRLVGWQQILQNLRGEADQIARTLTHDLFDGFVRAAQGGQRFQVVVNNLIRDLALLAVRAVILGPLAASISEAIAPPELKLGTAITQVFSDVAGHARGGRAKGLAVVGEKGPELAVGEAALVGQSGPELRYFPRPVDIVPNHRLMRPSAPRERPASAAPQEVALTFNIEGTDPERVRAIVRALIPEITQAVEQRGAQNTRRAGYQPPLQLELMR